MNELVGPCEALLVLGGEDRVHWPRCTAAMKAYWAQLARKLPAPKLIVSGGVWVRHGGLLAQECTLMANYLKAHGVAATDILEETQSGDTLGNVVWGGQLAHRQGMRCLALVTDDFHLWRSQRLYERVFGTPPSRLLGTGDKGSWHKRLKELVSYTRTETALRAANVPKHHPDKHRAFLQLNPKSS